MQFVVDMKISDTSRGDFRVSYPEAISFIRDFAIPTVQALGELKSQGKIIAGGPRAGDIWLTFIIEANSAADIDKMFEVLPLWPRLETTVWPLTTTADRIDSFKRKLAAIKDQIDSAFPKGQPDATPQATPQAKQKT